jgi:hypothetical protein
MIRTVVSDLGRVVLWFDNGIFLGKLAERAGRPFDEVGYRPRRPGSHA